MSKMHRTEPSSGMPADEDLDVMANKIAGCDFEKIVSPEHRAIVMDLAIKADHAGCAWDIAAWFRNSKLWDGM
ncbi:hypothetical protein EVC02_005 [Rhizobium phage RHph_N17]|nr:hypothetical protein EVC02_005 [Rhizobium phage RHph_N17]